MLIKNVFIGFFAMIALSATVFAQETQSYALDAASSTITWKGYKVTGDHTGLIDLKSGNLEFDNGELKGGAFEIDMATITCTDLEGGMKGKLEGHLKSADFFGVEKYPTAAFVITRVISRGTPGDYKVVGDLTIKESTNEIKFLVHIADTDAGMEATADLTIDRSEYDVQYGSGSFFDGLKDKTIYDEFDLGIKFMIAK